MRHPAVFWGAVFACLVTGSAVRAVEAGGRAPACELAALGASPSINTRDLAGDVVYIDFWASWCPPCVKSFPFMNELDRDLRERGLRVVAIDVDQQVEDARSFLLRHEARFAVGADPAGACPREFGVPGMPTSYLIDRKGVVRYVHNGFRDGEREELRRRIEALLAEDGAPVVAPAAGAGTEHHHHEQ